MVDAVELLGAFDGDHIADVFHHADHLLPGRVLLQILQFGVGNIVATAAEADPAAHFRHYPLKWDTSASSCRMRCSTSRNAVFFPIPGSLANSFTAFSNNEEEKIIQQNRFSVLLNSF